MALAPNSNCATERPDPKALWDSIASQFSAMVLGGADIVPESNEYYVTSLLYAMQEQFYAYSDELSRETDPRTACCENLLSIAAQWGMYPRPAQWAEGYVRITGDPNAALVDPLEMMAKGQEFRSVGTVPATLDADGVAIVRFRALEPGPASNLTPSSTGQLTNAPDGVNATVNIFGGQFCGGSDEETCEQFRQRVLDRMAYRPKATAAWLKEKIMEWPCVTRVCDRGANCCEDGVDDCCTSGTCNEGKNTFYVFMDGTFECGVPPQCVLDDIEAWLFGASPEQGRGLGQAPINVCGELVSPAVAKFDLNIDVHDCLTPNQAQAIEDALRGFMLTVCPSTDILRQQLYVVIGQVLGPLVQFDVTIIGWQGAISEGHIQVDDCGLRVNCDVAPCLASVRILSPAETGTSCGGL